MIPDFWRDAPRWLTYVILALVFALLAGYGVLRLLAGFVKWLSW